MKYFTLHVMNLKYMKVSLSSTKSQSADLSFALSLE